MSMSGLTPGRPEQAWSPGPWTTPATGTAPFTPGCWTSFRNAPEDRGTGFTAGIKTAALDPFRGYANAIRDEPPEAITVLDAFHVVKFGSAMVDEVRRQATGPGEVLAALLRPGSAGADSTEDR
jgi:hypothetical protein